MFVLVIIVKYFLYTEFVGDAPDDDEKDIVASPSAFDESWIVTKNLALKAVIASRGNKSRKHARQPKGTKPRRWKGRKTSEGACIEGPDKVNVANVSLDDTESTSSSIAIIPSPASQSRPAATTAAASAILAASNDAKQLAAISSARTVWQYSLELLQFGQTSCFFCLNRLS